MNKTILHTAIATLGFALLACACWIVAGALSDRMVQQELANSMRAERQIAASIVDNTAQIIASDLAMSRAIPATIAEMDMVQLALAASQNYAANAAPTDSARRAKWLVDPPLLRIDRFLSNARGYTGLDYVWLVNAHGFCVASSNATDGNSFVGIDMHGRGYIRQALLGAFNETYGVGRTYGDPGIFIATPVYREGLLVGAVIAKVSIDRLRHWVVREGTFITDANGVVGHGQRRQAREPGLAEPGVRADDPRGAARKLSPRQVWHLAHREYRGKCACCRAMAAQGPGKRALRHRWQQHALALR